MALHLPKLSAPRAVCWPEDDAFKPAPARDAFEDSPAGQKAYESAKKEYDDIWERFAETADVQVLQPVIVTGKEPTIFLVGSLTNEQAQHCDNAVVGISSGGAKITSGTKIWETIAYGVHDIRNLKHEDESGQMAPMAIKRVKGDAGMRLPEDVMRLFLDDGLRAFMFQRVQAARSLQKEARKSNQL